MTIYPTKVSTDEAIEIIEHYSINKIMVNTAADWGPSNPLNVVKLRLRCERKGIQKISFKN